MITREADYAIRAVLYLANRGDSRLVSTSELAEEMAVPYRFLRRIVQRLVEGGVLEAQRGKGGGVRLTRPCREVSVFDVLCTIDPRALYLNGCLQDDDLCDRTSFCSVRRRLDRLQNLISTELRAMTFDQLGVNGRTTTARPG